MEAVRDFLPFQDTDQGTDPGAGQGAWPALDQAVALLQELSWTAVEDSALCGFRAASEYAGQVEELSRSVEYLQLVAARAVDRTRNQAAASVRSSNKGWATGWLDSSASSPAGGSGILETEGSADDSEAMDDSRAVDDGYRNTTEFLRARLRISAAEARRRLSLAETVLPRQGLAGQPRPAAHEELGAALAAGDLASRAATIITQALDRVRHSCDEEASARMEHALTRTGIENDPDFLVRAARRWTDALDQDGAEPSEELLRQLQGAFIRRPRHGLHHLEIYATAEQFEHLLTVMNTATNPRTTATEAPGGPADSLNADASAGVSAALTAGLPNAGAPGTGDEAGAAGLDLRSRPQKLLDGLIGACKLALASGSLPVAGGLRPQVMVTIDYRDLLARLGGTSAQTGTLPFTGPVTASTVRKIACDADIIPVLLGGEGRILDIGRASRVFPPHIRKAIAARDQGCAFPGCTIPAPWCEAHHINYWSHGGTSGTDNGTLLCSHHHHLIHKEQWMIQVRAGIPWFIPPPHVDPRRVNRRNHYFRPSALAPAV
ncbi:MAG: hypothetical protein V7635_769 [Arthrobacter sp.]